MEPSSYMPIEEMECFRIYVGVADWAWDVVEKWKPLAQETVGSQLIRACDSVGANLVEGDGRSTDPDAARFFVIARASAREARYWLNRASKRRLIPTEVAEARITDLITATKMLNRLIDYRRKRKGTDRVADGSAAYSIDPFHQPPTPNA